MGRVHYADLWGGRKEKYEFLEGHGLGDTPWQDLKINPPYYFFVPKNFGAQEEYERGIGLTELFAVYNSGVQTGRDSVSIFFDEESMRVRLSEYKQSSEQEIKEKYGIRDSSDWNLEAALKDVRTNDLLTNRILYRPFDIRPCIYTGRKGIMNRPRFDVMQHILGGDNIGLIAMRRFEGNYAAPAFVTSTIMYRRAWTCPGTQGAESLFPLWLAPEEGGLIGGERRPNLRPEAVAKFAAAIGREPLPEEILQYVYGVLYSPGYRQKYNEFLKVDFPRIPLPNAELSAAEFFEKTVALGKRLIELHLMRFEGTGDMTYPERGDNVVGSVRFERVCAEANAHWAGVGTPASVDNVPFRELECEGRVYINDRQYFGGVSKEVWEYWIGGYQPMQKWLKDRRGRALSFEDIEHYMRIGEAIKGTIEAVRETNGYCGG